MCDDSIFTYWTYLKNLLNPTSSKDLSDFVFSCAGSVLNKRFLQIPRHAPCRVYIATLTDKPLTDGQ